MLNQNQQIALLTLTKPGFGRDIMIDNAQKNLDYMKYLLIAVACGLCASENTQENQNAKKASAFLEAQYQNGNPASKLHIEKALHRFAPLAIKWLKQDKREFVDVLKSTIATYIGFPPPSAEELAKYNPETFTPTLENATQGERRVISIDFLDNEINQALDDYKPRDESFRPHY